MMKQMKRFVYLLVLIVGVSLLATTGHQGAADAQEGVPLQEAIIGVWAFPVDGYYLGFFEDGRMCFGGSQESVEGQYWCNNYTLDDGVVTETCAGGPEDRNCPLGGGSCKARVSVADDGQLTYRILRGECEMLQHKTVPPKQHLMSRE